MKYTVVYSMENSTNQNSLCHTVKDMDKFTVCHYIETLKNFFKFNYYDTLIIKVYEGFIMVNDKPGKILDTEYKFTKDSPESFNIACV